MVDSVISWAVFRRDSYRCRYCDRDNVPLMVDYLVRWEEGGPTIPENLVSCCKKCNRTRGDMEYSVWLRSEQYLAISSKLSWEARQYNENLVSTLAGIQRVPVRFR